MLFEVLALAQTRNIESPPIILVGKEFWRRAFGSRPNGRVLVAS